VVAAYQLLIVRSGLLLFLFEEKIVVQPSHAFLLWRLLPSDRDAMPGRRVSPRNDHDPLAAPAL
jgi:hypothetical protein